MVEAVATEVPAAHGQMNGIGYRVEMRTWFSNGKYEGPSAKFVPCDTEMLAADLTGNFYGEWQGTRHHDGAEILRNVIHQATNNRSMLIFGGMSPATGDISDYPIRLETWGEMRVVTTGRQ